MAEKPLGIKNYGSIPHLPGSRMGPADKSCHKGQAKIATEKARDKNDEIIVQEKLDGSNVGVARIGNTIIPLGRAGYPAISSPFVQHRYFAQWAYKHAERFLAVLVDGERLVGEWLAQAHGTRYQLLHEPFVAIDLMYKHTRLPYDEFRARITPGEFVKPALLHRGAPLDVHNITLFLVKTMGEHHYGYHGALEPVEGAVWRVERDRPTGKKGEKKRIVDFLVKYVRPDKVDGKYLPEISGEPPVWNWLPDEKRTNNRKE